MTREEHAAEDLSAKSSDMTAASHLAITMSQLSDMLYMNVKSSEAEKEMSIMVNEMITTAVEMIRSVADNQYREDGETRSHKHKQRIEDVEKGRS